MPARSIRTATARQLTLDLVPSRGLDLPPTMRIIDAEAFGPIPTPRAALPPVTAWSARLSIGICEVLGGVRPSTQLSRWLSLGARIGLQHRARELAATRPVTNARRATPLVRSLRVSEPADGVAEVAAIVATDGRPTVLALRIEGLDGRWVCTEIGTPDGWHASGSNALALDESIAA